MAILEILKHPDPRLAKVSVDVTDFGENFQQFINDLEETRLSGPGAIGIAAPQVDNAIRAVIVDVSNMRKPVDNHGYMVLVNPKITQWSGMKVGREGCLSVPDFTGNVIRAQQITLEALNRHGNKQKYQIKGFEAVAVQHEMDHLDGLLFLDRLVSKRKDLFKRKKN